MVQFSTLAGSHKVSSPELPLSFDEFSPNIAENRIILTAIEVLKRNFNLSDSIREVLLRNQAKLSGVDLIPIGGRLPPYVISELNQHYKALLLTAELIVIGESVSASNGEKIAKSFLIDMAQLFENYLEVSFSKLSNQINLEFKPQKGNQYLDDQKIFRIRPDYLWFKNSTAVHLADAKYKVITNKSEISNADVNQIIAYCNRFGLKAGHLIYASSPEFMTKITNSDLELYVHQIDLSQSKKILEENVRDVFHAIIHAGV